MTAAVVRRLIVLLLLVALVTVAAIGTTGLLERVIGAASVLVADDAGLARALAFTLIALPLAYLLWRWERRALADVGERRSILWALYLAGMSVAALIVAANAVAACLAAGIGGEWRPGQAATAIVWAGVALWHRRMRRSPSTAPVRLTALTAELSALYGLIVAMVGAIRALAALLAEVFSGASPVLVSTRPWFVAALQALAWFLVGAAIWWWNRRGDRAEGAQGAFALVVLVVVIGGSAATALFATGTVLYVMLRMLFDTDPLADVLSSFDTAIAAALVGGLVWGVHALIVQTRPARVHRAARLAVSGVALIGAASGFGVVINALLAGLGETIIRGDPRTLLLGGLSALAVGSVAWWNVWRPLRHQAAGDPARRIYLVLVFGASAVVGLVTMLLIGYRLIEALLEGGVRGGMLESIRAPLGLLSATVLVFAYHFAIWRRDRALAPASGTVRRVERIVLVAAGDVDACAARLKAGTGARVTVWRAADDAALLSSEDMDATLARLRELSAPRVLVVADPGGVTRVVPLAG